MDAILEVRNLSKRFGGVEAVRDVSFDVPRGALVGLIGPNGAGKTTFVNLGHQARGARCRHGDAGLEADPPSAVL